MDGKKFDSLIKQFCTTRLTRKSALRGLVAGAAAAVTGASFGSGGVDAKKRRGRVSAAQVVTQCGSGGRQTRHLGEACGSTQCCVAAENLECQKVAETGAFRCECKTGFVRCGGQCVAISCPGGAQLNTTTCECVCPQGTEECPEGGDPITCIAPCQAPLVRGTGCSCVCPSGTPEICGGQCLAPCDAGFQRNPTTCACECPTGTVECNGQCVTECANGFVLNETTCQCECGPGTEVCNNTCRTPCEPGFQRNPTTCACECPADTRLCNGACVFDQCTGGQIFNEATCSCSCATNEVFCGGQCHNPATTCEGLHNKIFNIECCNQGVNPCQNPGQPSGKCKA